MYKVSQESECYVIDVEVFIYDVFYYDYFYIINCYMFICVVCNKS